jgi:hypothetical protein
MSTLELIILQIGHPIWYYNAFFYLFVTSLIFTGIIMSVFGRRYRAKNNELKTMQQQYLARIDNIRKEHAETLEKLRVEMLKREEERTRQWIESEKETLHVLNGVSTLLELDKRLSGTENEKILKLLNEIHNRITSIENTIKADSNENNK